MTKPDREAIARKEIGETSVHPQVALFLTVSFIAVIVSAAVWDLTARTVEKDFRYSSVSIGADAHADKTGGWFNAAMGVNHALLQRIDGYESSLNQKSPLSRFFLPPLQHLLTRYLRTGNEKVYVGKDRWLFYRPGIDYLTGPGFLQPAVQERRRRTEAPYGASVEPDPVAAIVEMKQALARQQIELIVVPTPTKAMLYGTQFMSFRSENGVLNNPDYDAFVQLLTRSGVHVVPVHELMARTPMANSSRDGRPTAAHFLRTDSHWSPEGVMRTADAIVKKIQKIKHLAPQDASRSPLFVRRRATVTNRGDLAVMLKTAGTFFSGDPLAFQETVEIHRVLTASGQQWRPDVAADVLLLGDSFSNIYSLEGMHWGDSAGLAEQVSFGLNRPIDAIRINDNGAFATRQALSVAQRKGRNRLRGKKVVVYEFAIRELTGGNWKTGLPLVPDTSTTGRATFTQRGGGPLLLKGQVKRLKTIPHVDQSAYRDCLIPLLVSRANRTDKEKSPEDLLVYVWGMLDGEFTAYNRLSAGDVVSLKVVPMETMEQTIGSYRRLDFSDTELMMRDGYMGDFRLPGGKHADVDTNRQTDTAPAPSRIGSQSSVEVTPFPSHRTSKEPPAVQAFLDGVTSILKTESTLVHEGRHGWFFLRQEMSHLAKGRFHGADAAEVSAAERNETADPLPAILDFHRQLEALGIALVMVPVPPKAVIYSDELLEKKPVSPPRLDVYHRDFYHLLESEGVQVVDLTDKFIHARNKMADTLYCRQDSHWSSAGCRLAATEIHQRIVALLNGTDTAKNNYFVQQKKIEVEGDLWRKLPERKNLEREEITIYAVSARKDTFTPVPPSRESPVLLLGDSHTLVFHQGGDMLAEGAGLADHLADALGFPVDVLGVRGSGATLARVSLLRRNNGLSGKKVVVWCFTARDFTESISGWAIVPVSR